MEEAKDLRELKSLLSGLPLQDNTGHSPGYRETGAVDASAQKIALLKSASVFLFSVSLFLSLLLVFLLVRVYIIGPADKDKQQEVAQPPVLEAVPAVTAPAPIVTAPPAPALPAVNQAALNEPAPADKEEPPAEKKDPPVKKEEPPAVMLKEAGGSLYFAALKHYGKADETIFDLILQANPAITDVRNIDDYHKIILPEITAESYIMGSPQDGYRVHVGTFETSQWAELYAASMKRKEKQVYIESRKFSPLDTWYRLTIGDFANKLDALQTVQSLQKRGLIYIPPQTE